MLKSCLLSLFLLCALGLLGQNSLGLSGGASICRLLNFNSTIGRHSLQSELRFGHIYSLSGEWGFSERAFRLSGALHFGIAELHEKSGYQYGTSVYYGWVVRKLEYRTQSISASCDLVFPLNKGKRTEFILFTGLFGSAIVKERTTGSESGPSVPLYGFAPNWSYVAIGSTTATRTYDNEKSGELSPYRAGVNLGWALRIPISERLQISLENRFSLTATHVIHNEYARYTTLIDGNLNAGIRYVM